MVNLSVLDLAYIGEGFTPADALHNASDLARHAEAAGYERFCLLEHHNLTGIASAATSVCICHVAGCTKTIRVGAGGIMLPNHSPMVIAEQFGTLATLFPERIDLGPGRAPGTDQRTLMALRRGPESSENFPQDVLELKALLGPPQENQFLHAIPGEDTNVLLWILGSSLYGAQLAGMLGLPYAFASRFAPQALMQAISVYREHFEPSKQLDKPYVMVGLQRYCCRHGRGSEAALHLTPTELHPHGARHPRPVAAAHRRYRGVLVAGGKAPCRRDARVLVPWNEGQHQLAPMIEETGADELMVAAAVWDHKARVHSFELLAEAMA